MSKCLWALQTAKPQRRCHLNWKKRHKGDMSRYESNVRKTRVEGNLLYVIKKARDAAGGAAISYYVHIKIWLNETIRRSNINLRSLRRSTRPVDNTLMKESNKYNQYHVLDKCRHHSVTHLPNGLLTSSRIKTFWQGVSNVWVCAWQ